VGGATEGGMQGFGIGDGELEGGFTVKMLETMRTRIGEEGGGGFRTFHQQNAVDIRGSTQGCSGIRGHPDITRKQWETKKIDKITSKNEQKTFQLTIQNNSSDF
jgi:hypothetical protein